MQVSNPVFAAIAFMGRFLRLSVLVAFVQTQQGWFGFLVEMLPEWVRGWAEGGRQESPAGLHLGEVPPRERGRSV